MAPYQPTHLPYGLKDPAKRVIRNPGLKDEANFLRYGVETGGDHFSVRVTVKGGGGVPIHRHYGYSEIFNPVSGAVGVVGENGTKTMILRPDDTYQVQSEEWHRFFNPSETASIVFEIKIQPAHQGFDKLLYIYYGLADDGHGRPDGAPKSLFHALMLMNMGGVGYPGLVGWLFGVFVVIAGLIAGDWRRRALDQEILR
ncbi:hypothetical protein LTR91_012824 [Friedmanniomyces endolithicus]|uniref:Cupin type-2 domain-containing protein n=1 Tax=Friedmanniomyces endolithicus TaxID=329885 RepID=A0AAN6KEM5_9PEZI|nr:hypothetical protein LTR94_003224 [Friedmanniomyces endolithicus]KAK0782299.1 hypothetical protein LTR75_014446 [Friedmanniomyces endolithicus]KAK0805189.1 hypothetical protein LTR59_004130 [Friedmanniomyces endolithicus]KAK0814432.1 hypothetical protein LTR38_002722 [Friedmanniomyces endolithicus]KAK0850807.1 hypothetical protein LTS02_013056 [Friedmanniomyces endolithicus]